MPVVRPSIAPGIVARRRPPVAHARMWRLNAGRPDPRRFGRATLIRSQEPAPEPRVSTLGPDIKLFLMTFLAGFLFVSILLA